MRLVVMIAVLLAAHAAACAAGIDAYGETKMTDKSVNVHISEPTVVAVAPKEVGWGCYQFPAIERWADGTFCVTYNMAADAAENYGAPPGAAVSADGGKTWSPHSGELGVSGLLLPNGDRIGIATPKPYKVADLHLPEPVGIVQSTYATERYTMYRLGDLEPKLRTIRISRLPKGAERRVEEHAWLDDPQALRYSLREVFPIIWWGDMRLASDGSIIAGIYPGYRMRDDGTVDPKGGVFFYRSTDFGHSWKIQGRILYQPDTKADKKGDLRAGFTEPAFEFLADGSLLCMMRTSDGLGTGPMYGARSSDLGKTWSRPMVIAANGVLPKLLRLENGVLALASGRPGVQLRFCANGKGKKWTEPFEIVPPTPSSPGADTCGYTGLVTSGPDSFIIAYSHFKHTNEKGELRKAILVREVKVKTTDK